MIRASIANPYEYPWEFQAFKAAAGRGLRGRGVARRKVTLAFVDNAHIHRLNKRFLDHDEPTDVLTFPYTGGEREEAGRRGGDRHEVAQEYAADRGHDVKLELLLYVIHGCLHLCGYDGQDDAGAAAEMRAKEREYLAKLGLPDIAREYNDSPESSLTELKASSTRRAGGARGRAAAGENAAYCRCRGALIPLGELRAGRGEVERWEARWWWCTATTGVRSLSGAAILARRNRECRVAGRRHRPLVRAIDPSVPRY